MELSGRQQRYRSYVFSLVQQCNAASRKYGIAFKKGTHEELAEELTETLTEMQNEGITEEIVTKYGLDADETLPGGESK